MTSKAQRRRIEWAERMLETFRTRGYHAYRGLRPDPLTGFFTVCVICIETTESTRALARKVMGDDSLSLR